MGLLRHLNLEDVVLRMGWAAHGPQPVLTDLHGNAKPESGLVPAFQVHAFREPPLPVTSAHA
jgi:hypothetical protein